MFDLTRYDSFQGLHEWIGIVRILNTFTDEELEDIYFRRVDLNLKKKV